MDEELVCNSRTEVYIPSAIDTGYMFCVNIGADSRRSNTFTMRVMVDDIEGFPWSFMNRNKVWVRVKSEQYIWSSVIFDIIMT